MIRVLLLLGRCSSIRTAGYLSCRTNGTTAMGSTRDGKTIMVTFWAASPPRAPCFTIYGPDLKPSAFGRLPKAIYSEDDLVLLRVHICGREDSLYAENNHYFVYQDGAENRPPSLKLIPIPPGFIFSDCGVALLRCREQAYMFYIALLHRAIDGELHDREFDLHMYNSKTGTWNTESMHVDSQDFSYTYTGIVLTMGGEFGSVGWVDLWRGILICDLLRDKHSLRYIPLPLPLVPKPLKGYPPSIRNIIVLEDYIKFFELRYVRPGSNTGCTGGSEGGLVAATKKMKNSDIGSGNENWEVDCTFKFSEFPVVDSLNFTQLLLNLKQSNGTKLTLNRLHAGYPALSLHDADVVYIMHTPDPDEDKAFVIAVDMRNKTLKDAADFGGSGRPLGYSFTYLQSGISKHLNVWSSSSNFVRVLCFGET